MYAIAFQATIQNGMIEVPRHYHSQLSKHAKVIVLMDETSRQTGLLEHLLHHPLTRPDFTPLSREDVYEER